LFFKRSESEPNQKYQNAPAIANVEVQLLLACDVELDGRKDEVHKPEHGTGKEELVAIEGVACIEFVLQGLGFKG
jgi:hypothetical protein